MNKLGTVLLAAVVWFSPAALGQNNTEELPSAPSPVQSRFPGAPAETPKKLEQSAPAPVGSPGDATKLTTLPPAVPAQSTAGQNSTAQQSSGASQTAHQAAYQAEQKTDATPPSGVQKAKAEEPEETGEFRIGVEVQLVDLIFTATDKHGRFIKDLKKDDIRLLDEGKPPARVEAFESETELPLRVGLLIDASNSIRDRFRFEQDAAVEFLHQVVRPDSDRAFVIGFDSQSDLTQDYTDNGDALARGVRVLRPGGGTALHDAVLEASNKLANAPIKGPARRAIILLSDGDDNQSRRTREEAIEAALHAGVIVYVISTNISGMNKKGDKILMRYAEATGGRVFFPLRIEEVANAFSEIQDELRSQYVIAYKPQDFVTDGRYRPISITAPKRTNVKIRARKGYYAPKSQK